MSETEKTVRLPMLHTTCHAHACLHTYLTHLQGWLLVYARNTSYLLLPTTTYYYLLIPTTTYYHLLPPTTTYYHLLLLLQLVS